MSTPFDQLSGLGIGLLGLPVCKTGPLGLSTTLDPMSNGVMPYPTPDTGNQAGQGNPRLTDDNVQLLGRVLTAECGTKLCTPQEIQAAGSTVINRMDKLGTDDVADVAKPGQYAIAKQSDPGLAFTAYRLLSGQLGDNTGGARYFYSPRSMPMEGQDIAGRDVKGGLEQIPGQPVRNYRPGWAKTYPQKQVDGVRDWFFKLYTDPSNNHD